MKPSVPNPCSVCGIPIFGSFIGTGDGTMKNGGSFAHSDCYYRDYSKRLEAALQEKEREAERLKDAVPLGVNWKQSMADMASELADLRFRLASAQEVVEAARVALYDAGEGPRIDNCEPCNEKLVKALAAYDATFPPENKESRP